MVQYFGNPRNPRRRSYAFDILGYSPTFAIIPQLYGTFTDEAGTTPTTSDGDLVACAKDGVGAFHVTQGTSGNRPTVQTTSGIKVLRFDGTNDILSTTGLSMGAERTVFLGCKFNSASGLGCPAQISNGVAQGSMTRFFANNGTMVLAGELSDISTYTYDTNWHLGGFIHRATTPKYSKDLGALTSLSNLTVVSFTNQPLRLGNTDVGNIPFAGDLAFLIAFDRAMSESQFVNVQTNLFGMLPP